MANPLHGPLFGGDVKGTRGAYRHVPHVCATMLARGDDRTHHVARLKATHAFGSFGASSRKPGAIHAAHLTTTRPLSRDVQRDDMRDIEWFGSTGPDTCSIQPMRLGQVTVCSIELRTASCPHFDGQSNLL